MILTENIEFDESIELKNQTQEVKQWIQDNCESFIDDQFVIKELDLYNRPKYYDFTFDTFKIYFNPQYLFQDASTWANSGYSITFETI